MSLSVGLTGRCEGRVTQQNTAAAVGSGTLPVFATPMMVALMEAAAVDALKGHLESGQGSVGTAMSITHDAATPVGMKVWAQAELIAIDRRSLTFSVSAFDESGPIGQGEHKRFLIDDAKFLAKAQGKLEVH